MDDLSDSDDDSDIHIAPVNHMEGDRKSIPERARKGMPRNGANMKELDNRDGISYISLLILWN